MPASRTAAPPPPPFGPPPICAHLCPSVPTCAYLRPPASHPTAPCLPSDTQYLDSLTFPSPCLHRRTSPDPRAHLRPLAPTCPYLRLPAPICAHQRPIQPPLASILTNSTWTALPFPPRACIPHRRTSPDPPRPLAPICPHLPLPAPICAHLRPSAPTCTYLRPIQPPLASILTNSTWIALPFPPRACIPHRRTYHLPRAPPPSSKREPKPAAKTCQKLPTLNICAPPKARAFRMCYSGSVAPTKNLAALPRLQHKGRTKCPQLPAKA